VDGIAEFLEHLRAARRVSPHTLRAYEGDLRRFVAHAAAAGAVRAADVGPAEIKRYAAALLSEGAARTSVARRLAAVRTFYKFLSAAGAVDADPASVVRAPAVRRRLPRALDDDAVARLLAAPRGESFLARRDRAALELLYSAGLRNAELVGLDLDRLDLDRGLCRVLGKGRKERLAVVGSYAQRALRDYLDVRAEVVRPAAGGAVFLNRFGTRLDGRSLRRIFARHLVRADLPAGTTPHTLRHTFATHLLERGASLKEVQELLGHRHLSSTQIYTHLTPEHLRAAYEAAHPRARRLAEAAS
jgi:integrase/recombinase XerC